jgi:hypothetical protein
MTALQTFGRELLGLFLDDEFLAVAVLIVVGTAALLAKALTGAPLVAGAVLIAGSVTALLFSIWQAART